MAKINSPFARYTGPDGKILECSVCEKFINNAFTWHQHVRSDQHQKKLEEFRKKTSSDGKPAMDAVRRSIKSAAVIASNASNTANVPPEGFFDDPVKEAKVRKVKFEDRIQAQMDQFNMEVKSEIKALESVEEQEEADTSRGQEMDAVNDLMDRWAVIQKLHDQKDSLDVTSTPKTNDDNDEQDDDDCSSLGDHNNISESDLDNLFHWRSM